MKNNYGGSSNWKNDLVQKWQKMVLTYRKMREHPTAKTVLWFCAEFLKVCFRLMLRKLMEEIIEILR